MNLRFLGLVLLLSGGLGAQTGALRVLLARDALETKVPATLVVLDRPGDRSLAEGFGRLLQEGPLKPFEVALQAAELGSGAGRKAVARYRLDPSPQWLLIGAGEAVLARGTTVPSAGDFLRGLEKAGFHDRVKELRAYLRDHPESLEARERLLALLRERGEAAAQRAMGVEVPAPKARLEQGDLEGYLQSLTSPARADLSAAKALDPLQDLEAWGAFAQELDQAFRSGIWRELDLAFTREGRPLDAASPTLRALYRRSQPAVEAALHQEPGAEPLWDLWIWMAQAQGGGGLRPLLATLKPSPLTPKGAWPPERAVRLLLATARTPQDWRTLEEHFQARWTGSPQMLRDRPPEDPGQGVNGLLLEREWNGLLAPLLESALRCGDTAQAEALLREALDASCWPPLPAKAARLAERCAQPTLARRWSAFRPGSPR
jgi:hypothetical protein